MKIFLASAALILLALLAGVNPVPSEQQTQNREFSRGDVLVSLANGQIQWHDPNGNLIETLDSQVSGEADGLAFNIDDKNLYVTNYTDNAISIFNSTGNLLGQFGSDYNNSPESILFDQKANVYVGQANGDGAILKFDSAGKLLAKFQVKHEDKGSDWIDLAPDQCTMYYTSEGISIKRFNVCTKRQLSDFATNLPWNHAYAFRLLPSGGLLVADSQQILRLDKAGKITQTYDALGQDDWFALNLDPDGKSFWSANITTTSVFKFDISTGDQLMTFTTGPEKDTCIAFTDHNECVTGLAIVGEITAVQLTQTPNYIWPIAGGIGIVAILILIFKAISSPSKVAPAKLNQTKKRKVELGNPEVKAIPHPDIGEQKVTPHSNRSLPEIGISLMPGMTDYFIDPDNTESNLEKKHGN